jgi:hypothetical protein
MSHLTSVSLLDRFKSKLVLTLQPFIFWLFNNYQSGRTKLFQITCIILSILWFCFSHVVSTKLPYISWIFDVLFTILLLLSLAIQFMLTYFTGASADITKHVYKTTNCKFNGRLCGNLYYSDHLPIIELHSENPFENGYAQGFLLAEQIKDLKTRIEMLQRLLRPLGLVHSVIDSPKFLEELKKAIPEKFMKEIEGLVNGYNTYWDNKNSIERLNFYDVLDWQLMADSRHLNHTELEWLSCACTTILKGKIFGRNMDWSGFGKGGENSLLIVWQHEGVAAYNPPGIIGCVTGWNKYKLCMSINVCPGDTKLVRSNTLPIALFTRYVLSIAETTTEVRNYFTSECKDPNVCRPLGQCHVTLADSTGPSMIISYYQDKDYTDHIRQLEVKSNNMIYGLNWCEPAKQGGFFNSIDRDLWLKEYKNQDDTDDLTYVQYALSHSKLFNCWVTIHNLLFVPCNDLVYIRNNNGFAPSNPIPHVVKLTKVFQSKY